MKHLIALVLSCVLLASVSGAQGFPNPGPGIRAGSATADVTPPAVPTALTQFPGGTTITLSWTHSTSYDVDHYNLRIRCPSGSGGYTNFTTPQSFGVAGGVYTFTGLVSTTACDMSVSAVDAAGNASAYATDVTGRPDGGAVAPNYPVANGVEQRCTDLGANCICSEPLNGNEGMISAVNHDFSSSNDATECGGRSTAPGSISPAPVGANYPTFVPVSQFGSGNPFGSMAYVLKSGGNQGYFFFHGRPVTNTSVLASTDTQVCWRIYKGVSSNYGNTGGSYNGPRGECATGTTWRNKMFQLNFANQAQAFQPEEQAYANEQCITGGPYGTIDGGNDVNQPGGGGWSGILPLVPSITWEAMKVVPARLEFCAESRDAGGVRGGNKIVVRTRIKRLDTGVISTSTTPETTGWGTISGYDYSGVNADHSGPGNDYYGMFIQTKSQADPNVTTHWPGCSPEVEGSIVCPVAGGD